MRRIFRAACALNLWNGNMKINVRLSAASHTVAVAECPAGTEWHQRNGMMPLENFDKPSGIWNEKRVMGLQ